jgi:pantoate--beta-alanine ligase
VTIAVAVSRTELAGARATMDGRVGVVMTMGALHAGHAALIRHAQAGVDRLIVTIFVNPLQFGPAEDFGRYPRSLDADLALCAAEAVDLVFAPTLAEVYPSGEPEVRVSAGPRAQILEGAARPGHFDGVLTVVLKLLQLTGAGLAYFGEKDYQQLTLVRSMVRDLDLPVSIASVATVRDGDGLALSSRNRYLSPAQREAALALHRGLRAGAQVAMAGGGAGEVVVATRKEIDATPGVALDYAELRDPWLGPPPASGTARLLVAARVGTTRLIDNVGVQLAVTPR